MKLIKYFFQFIIIFFLFIIFKILGLKNSSNFASLLSKKIGPFFRSKELISKNILKAFPNISKDDLNHLATNMWGNYGRILAEYVFLKNFRKTTPTINLKVVGQEILDEIRKNKKPVIFISGHFNNFELMAMHIEKSGINLATIYRPLNNPFLNVLMENIRKKYICKKQIEKGIAGTRQLLKLFRKKTSIALMIDQRVSEGINCQFFGHNALTTTIPAQFVKKFNVRVVPVHIERILDNKFIMNISKPIRFNNSESIYDITLRLNKVLETMILKNPDQWIWTHNRWKQ